MDKQAYKTLAEQASNGDTKAFSKLYETVCREMYYTAYYSLADEGDAIEAVTDSVRAGFSAVGKLHTPEAFREFMLKAVCARIKMKFKAYAAGIMPEADYAGDDEDYDVKREFMRLEATERLITSMYAGAKLKPDEIAAYTGLSVSTVRKKLDRVLSRFALD